MIRMEIACFLVIAFLSIMYFSTRREQTKLHKVFSTFLIMSMFHLIFDGATIYTVNRLDTIPEWLNDGFHRMYIATMNIVFYYVCRYISTLIETDTDKKPRILIYSTIVLVVGLVMTIFLPITYIRTDKGNYSYGAVAYMLYISLTIYIIIVIIIFCRYWKYLHQKKRRAITIAMIIQVAVFVCQAIYPLSLISGMGIMLVALSFYLTMENPDIALVIQVKKEKRKADEANAAKSKFLSNMSHEIRTPMNAIVGMTEILLRTDLTEEQEEYLLNIKNSGNALVAIINDILDITKIEAGKLELMESVYELNPMLRELRMMTTNRIGEKPVEFLVEVDDNLPNKLFGDGLRIRQILVNLLGNATKFTEIGYVKLTIKIMEKTDTEYRMTFSVSDTGQGIKQEDITRLFGAFEQVDLKKNIGKEGTGLGLAISSQLVDMMGGKLEVRSQYGIGSEFYFTITQGIVESDENESEETETDSMNFIAPDAKILIVDDNIMNCKVAAGLLAPLQMQIENADNGKNAIEMVKKKKYDIVFMDHMMPVMDGIEATNHIRKLDGEYYCKLPIIALSANAMKDAEREFIAAGMDGFVAKPIDVRQMCSVIEKWLPKELIIRQSQSGLKGKNTNQKNEKESIKKEAENEQERLKNAGIDWQEGLLYTGNEDLLVSLLGDFYKLIDMKSLKVEQCLADNMVRDYTIEVHALKNTARMIGAKELSEKFLYLEQLGNEGDLKAMQENTPDVLRMYRSYKPVLQKYGERQKEEQKEVTTADIINCLERIKEAVEGFDLDRVDEAMESLEEMILPQNCRAQMEMLRVYVADVAMENIIETVNVMLQALSVKE